MKRIPPFAFLCLAMWSSAPMIARAEDAHLPKVSYSRDIQPLLANSCYACHGPDAGKRQADLRLDIRDIATHAAIIPGKAAKSPLIERITSTNPDERMPPPDSKRPRLTPAQAELIRRWIDEGAPFETHWAYVPPVRPPLPDVKSKDWVLNPIDRFVAAVHEKQGLHASPDADPRALVRRLHFDLTGLPPSPEEADAFAADHSPAAYERLVDRLIASPRFGERMAMYWLDVVRYADSGGYHSDNERTVWPYRDYVVAAFNSNKPFDRFVIEQLAGDLIPPTASEPENDPKIASGYNRLLQTTEEGGAQAKEYTAKYAADRVRNTATAFLGSTVGCCQCHDHKYDPFKTKDFYSFAAFFADVDEKAVGRQEQTPLLTHEQSERLKQLDARIEAAEKRIAAPSAKIDDAQAAWEGSLKNKVSKESAKDPKVTSPYAPPRHVAEGSYKKLPKPVADALTVEANDRNAAQRKTIADYYRTIDPGLAEARSHLASLKQSKKTFDKNVPSSLVTTAAAPREVRVLPRGNWQDDSGEVVTPAIPVFLGLLDVKDRRATRLDLARWMVARDNPLVARVFVNRLWKLMYGQGLARTVEDMGTQGARPTHPELLDWLAVEFMESGWNVKYIVKLMVMSRTYRQTSRGTPELDQKDPANLWLARQGRFRLDAETVRDNALAASGLLSLRMGGPPAKPYQPAGYWSFLNFPKREWQADHNENEYRRGLYTFWQRTFLHPSLLAFDAPTREECTVDRTRSNTPLQALVLLNDPTYVEASRAFAARVVREGGGTEAERLRFAFHRALAREPSRPEADLLEQLYRRHLAEYQADEASARALLKVGDAPAPKDVAVAELAAWTSVTRVILNLHETITRD